MLFISLSNEQSPHSGLQSPPGFAASRSIVCLTFAMFPSAHSAPDGFHFVLPACCAPFDLNVFIHTVSLACDFPGPQGQLLYFLHLVTICLLLASVPDHLLKMQYVPSIPCPLSQNVLGHHRTTQFQYYLLYHQNENFSKTRNQGQGGEVWFVHCSVSNALSSPWHVEATGSYLIMEEYLRSCDFSAGSGCTSVLGLPGWTVVV